MSLNRKLTLPTSRHEWRWIRSGPTRANPASFQVNDGRRSSLHSACVPASKTAIAAPVDSHREPGERPSSSIETANINTTDTADQAIIRLGRIRWTADPVVLTLIILIAALADPRRICRQRAHHCLTVTRVSVGCTETLTTPQAAASRSARVSSARSVMPSAASACAPPSCRSITHSA